MSNKKQMKKMLTVLLSAAMACGISTSAYAGAQALPNGTIISQGGAKYLTDPAGNKYSGWFIDSKEDWYYFNESDKAMKTGWHHDDKDGYWYYLNPSDGKMATGWQTIDGKEYFFQPMRDMGNYHFNNEQEKWLYSLNSKVPYGAMYVNTTTPDGSKVDTTGAKVSAGTSAQNNNSMSDNAAVKNGWLFENGSWRYYENGTAAKNKWLNLDGKWYYVSADGAMVSNTWKEINGKSYYFGSDGAMYENTTTSDGNEVDENSQLDNGSVNYSETLNGKFIYAEGDEYISYSWWKEHGEDIYNDERIKNYGTNDYDRMALVYQYYPEIPDYYWTITDIQDNEFSITKEEGIGIGHYMIGGYLVWKGNDTATMIYDQNSGSSKLKVLDENTIEIDGEKLIKIDRN